MRDSPSSLAMASQCSQLAATSSGVTASSMRTTLKPAFGLPRPWQSAQYSLSTAVAALESGADEARTAGRGLGFEAGAAARGAVAGGGAGVGLGTTDCVRDCAEIAVTSPTSNRAQGPSILPAMLTRGSAGDPSRRRENFRTSEFQHFTATGALRRLAVAMKF